MDEQRPHRGEGRGEFVAEIGENVIYAGGDNFVGFVAASPLQVHGLVATFAEWKSRVDKFPTNTSHTHKIKDKVAHPITGLDVNK